MTKEEEARQDDSLPRLLWMLILSLFDGRRSFEAELEGRHARSRRRRV